VGVEPGSIPFLLACLVITITVASLSWFLLEKPINSLKTRFRVAPAPFSETTARGTL
jgi:peptidoglycan/LPS O-acetylase OafA/YrhL